MALRNGPAMRHEIILSGQGISRPAQTETCLNISEEIARDSSALLERERRKLRPAHIGAGAGVDLDRFALFDEERDVDRLAGLEFCRFSYVTGGITADTLG